MRPIYLDYNATTPIAAPVADAMRPLLDRIFGNPSSSHVYGVEARAVVDRARAALAELLGCQADELVFTSGGSESNNHAIQGVARLHPGGHLVYSAVEHPAVSEVCLALAEQGWQVSVVPVDGLGRVEPEALRAAMRPDTVLVSVMHANNEVGTVQPIAKLARVAHEGGALFHCDAAQSVGKIPVRVDELGVDLLSVAGHKLYAPKGIGALYIRHGLRLPKLIHGADHERNQRAGTENILEIAGLGAAAALALAEQPRRAEHLAQTRDRLQAGLREALPDAVVQGDPAHRLPNTLSISFPGIEANTLLSRVSEQVAASAGAACHTDRIDVSGVLQAMAVPERIAMGTVRLSTGRATTMDDVDQAIAAIVPAVRALAGAAAPRRQ